MVDVLVDASYLVALGYPRDRNHQAARQLPPPQRIACGFPMLCCRKSSITCAGSVVPAPRCSLVNVWLRIPLPPPVRGKKFVFSPDVIDEQQGLRLIEAMGVGGVAKFQPTPRR